MIWLGILVGVMLVGWLVLDQIFHRMNINENLSFKNKMKALEHAVRVARRMR